MSSLFYKVFIMTTRFPVKILLLLFFPLVYLVTGTLLAATPFNSSPGATSYSCGKTLDDNPFGLPGDTRVCVCDKGVAGDCKAMEDEACKVGFLTCEVGKTTCWCQEKPEGPSTRTTRDHRYKQQNTEAADTLAPTDSSKSHKPSSQTTTTETRTTRDHR